MQVAEVFQQNVDLSDSCVAAKQEVRVSKRLTHKPGINARWFGRTFKQKSWWILHQQHLGNMFFPASSCSKLFPLSSTPSSKLSWSWHESVTSTGESTFGLPWFPAQGIRRSPLGMMNTWMSSFNTAFFSSRDLKITCYKRSFISMQNLKLPYTCKVVGLMPSRGFFTFIVGSHLLFAFICHVASGLELSHGLRAIPSSDTDLAWRNLSSLTLWDPLTDCLRKILDIIKCL